MDDERKSKKQLISELVELRQRIAQLGATKATPLEEALRESEARYKLLTEKSVLGLYIIQDSRMAYVNPSLARIFGYEPEEIIGKLRPEDLIHPDDIQVVMQRLHERLDGKIERSNVAYRAVKKDGSPIYIEVYGVLTEFQGGPAVMGTLIDITKRRKAEESQRESEEQLRNLVEQSPVAIMTMTTDGQVNRVNASYMKLWDIGQESVSQVYERFNLLQDEQLRELGVMPLVEEAFKGKAVILPPLEYDALDTTKTLGFTKIEGRKRWVLTRLYPVKSGNGEITGVVLMSEDITERVRTEEALRLSEEKFREMAESLPEVVYECDAQGNLTFTNRVAFEKFGYAQEDFDKGLNALQFISPDDRERAGVDIEEILHSDGKGSFEYMALRRDESEFPVVIHSSPIIRDGRPVGLRGIIVDFTAYRETEVALRESEEKFSKLFQTSPNVLVISSLQDGRIIDMNDQGIQKLGYQRDEIIGKNLVEIRVVDAEDLKKLIEMIQEDGHYSGVELKVKSKDGSEKYGLFHGQLIEIGGELLLFQTVIDITEDKQAAEALRESEYRLTEAQSMAHIGHWQLDPHTQNVEGSDELSSIFGLAHEERTLEAFIGAVHPDDREYHLYHIRRGMEQGEPWEIEHRVVCKDGTEKYVRAIGEAIKDDAGRVVKLVGTVQDITESKQVAMALEESENRYRLLIEATPSVIWMTDESGDTIFISPNVVNVYGYTSKEILEGGETLWLGRIHKDDLERVEQAFSLLFSEHRKYDVEYRIKSKDSHWIWLHDQADIIEEHGGMFYAVGEFSDITDRKRAEGAVRDSEERLQMLFESAPDGYYLSDLKGNFIDGNKAAEELLGYKREELIGKNFTKLGLLSLRELPKALKGLASNALGLGTRPVEYSLIRKDGSAVPVEIRTDPVKIKGKTVVLGIVRDITERKQAEAERELLLARISGQAQQLEEVISTVPEGMLLLNAKGQVILTNPVAERDLAVMTDAKASDIITHLGGRPLAELLTSPPASGLWHEVTAGNRTFEIIGQPVAGHPEADNWVLVINDVTQEREIQQRTQQQERLAAVGQLAAGIAHDFNNIMAVIVLYTQLELGMPDIPARLRDRLQTILQQANLSTELIQQILDFSRRAVLERRPMDLMPFLKEVVRLLERTVPESIRIEFTHGTDEYTVNADPTRMQQVIMNLVVNARDAMPEGGELSVVLSRIAMTDEIRCVTCGQVIGGEWISIAVTDTGGGIPPDVLPYIFEPFFTTKAPGQGTGLGLAQVHGIVTQHEGHIDVTSTMEEGTTLTFYLPAFVVQEVAEPSGAIEDAPRGQGETVLVVEDNAKMREAFADILEMLNYQVLISVNGRDALDIL